jgi:hypothetical protein
MKACRAEMSNFCLKILVEDFIEGWICYVFAQNYSDYTTLENVAMSFYYISKL